MPFLQTCFNSAVLSMQTQMWVLLPQPVAGKPRRRRRLPVLYLLHGLSDDHTIWMRRTSIERYVDGLHLAVVMPTTHRGFYTDMVAGPRYWTHISEEVPHIARGLFGLSERREDTFVAGLSMGGYGAFKLALRKPDVFAAAASFSGAMDILPRVSGDPGPWTDEMQRIFGTAQHARGSDNDLFHLATRLKRTRKPVPRLYQTCGDKDYLLDENRRFRDRSLKLGLPLTYEEDPGFGHTWDYWDLCIQRALTWMGLKR